MANIIARVFLSAAEYECTKRVVDDFKNSDAPFLHKILKQKSETSRNWVEKWWEDLAYLEGRYPSFPLVNFGGSSPDYHNFPPKAGTQLERAALVTYHLCRYWKCLRQEKIPITNNRGTPWCMEQVHRLFNTCKIPGLNIDKLHFYFKTETEGSCPSHVVVICRDRLWKIETRRDDGELYTPPQLETTLRMIRSDASRSTGSFLNALTCWDRTNWFKTREHIISLDPENKNNLKLIETAILVLSLTDDSPSDDSQLGFYSIAGDCRCQFADKSLVFHFHKNGLVSTCSDHSNIDAVVSMALSNWVDAEIGKDGFRWPGSPDSTPHSTPVELRFKLDAIVTDAVQKSIEFCNQWCSDLHVAVRHYSGYGNKFFRTNKLYGDTIVQLALQLAYFRVHKKPAPTYETSSTRKFYHGRTETVRSCTEESTDWCRSVLKSDQNFQKFTTAVNKHNLLMDEATEARGCDRHLFGMRQIAKEMGMKDPEIFSDPAWKKSGGDGQFVLSTSFIGYSNVFGGVAPMCLDGYGVFYKIQSQRITFFVSTWKSSVESDCWSFIESLWWSLDYIHELLCSNGCQKPPLGKL